MRLLLPLISLATIALCAPAPTKRSVLAAQLSPFNLAEQWAAAAACPSNNNATGSRIVCTKDNACPIVSADDTDSVLEFQNTQTTDTTGFVARDDTNQRIIVSFRGSAGVQNWMANLRLALTDVPELCAGCQSHDGFWAAWNDVAPTLIPAVQNTASAYPDYSILVTGHSLGAAIATLGATVLRNQGMNVDLVTFGSPRVGNGALADYMTNQNMGDSSRFTHAQDPVPMVPLELMGYVHMSPEYWITAGNGVPVGANDITVCTGIGNDGCNAQYGITTAMADHGWYFADIGGCYAAEGS